MPFYKAFDQIGNTLAEKLDITESGAKRLMKDIYRDIEGRELYDTGKALEEKHHRPNQDEQRAESQSKLALEPSRPRLR